jgi:predicted DNA-binding protein with PD1-like motif
LEVIVKSAQLYAENGIRAFALVLDKGDEAVQRITDFARDNEISGASLTAVGGCSEVTLGYFDPQISDYRSTDFCEQMEVLSLLGDIATKDDDAVVHAHIVLGRRDSSTVGGHLQKLKVFPTLEIVITETPTRLRKRVDPTTGLALIAIDEAQHTTG